MIRAAIRHLIELASLAVFILAIAFIAVAFAPVPAPV